jgi:tetratricopeptide (TPR) repeat protein
MMPPQTAATDDPATSAFPTGSALPPDLLAELPHDAAFAVWQVLRCLQLWTAEPEGARREVFDREYMEAWERRLLSGTLDAEARFPLAVVVGELAAPPGAATGRLPWACVCVADWALGRGARRAGLAFAEAAARTAPQHPRYAWLAGRLLRGHGNAREGERWLRRAHRLAVAQRDWETQARSLTSMGNAYLETGRYPEARGFHARSLRISRRYRLREQEAMALHDLMVIAIVEGNHAEAEDHARGALNAYCPSDPRVAKLAHDLGYLWMEKGYFARALGVFEALLPHFEEPDDRLRVMAMAGRAAGSLGQGAVFARIRTDAETLLPSLRTGESLARAMLELAYGAVALGDWNEALCLSERAGEASRARSESDVLVLADRVISAAQRRDQAELEGVAVVGLRRMGQGAGEELAEDLIASLTRGHADAA